MSSTILAENPTQFKRIIGTYKGCHPGPTLVVVGGIHGNEPAGAIAIQRVLQQLHHHQPEFSGNLIGIAGNLDGLRKKKRYIDEDLNRMWRPEYISGQKQDGINELDDFHAINQEIRTIIKNFPGPITVIDFHSFSAPGSPFIVSGNKRKNARLVANLPAPVVFGLGQFVRGTLINYIERLGHRGIAIEGGQHDDPDTVLNVEAFLWLVLERAGCLEDRHAPVDLEQSWLRLRGFTEHMPRWVRLKYRYNIDNGEQFVMRPGFRNFDAVHSGDHLADNRKGAIHSPMSGRMLMPLYQGQGKDGFFITVEENFGSGTEI